MAGAEKRCWASATARSGSRSESRKARYAGATDWASSEVYEAYTWYTYAGPFVSHSQRVNEPAAVYARGPDSA